MKELSENELWELIDKSDWSVDHDYKRIEGEWQELDREVANQLRDFADSKQGEFQSKYESDWLGEPGIGVSDDGWSDLSADVVGRGKKFYESITVEKLQRMADTYNYYENFLYSFHFLYD